MISIVMELAKGNSQLAAQFSAAVDEWRKFHESNLALSENPLSQKLGSEQFRHEGHFGGDRHLGKMSMPLATLAALYDEANGFADNRDYAIRIAKAFAKSSVSIEIKGIALTAAIVAFGLEEDPVLKEFVKHELRF
ncbi:hypothetical protein [Sphingorhabdus sp. EL138]|uniref:hypothetical protein n=1 Tax=Sphingorhabdus sp. EL138 TaxID=2073156 RepID=UPI0025E3605B|nr:hypothetical protein [Sphingorhabdus sp. EL138]